MKTLQATQQDMPDTGYFRANVTSQRNSRPISGATIQISDINNPEDILEEITTDQNGQSETVSLGAPPLEYSMVPESNQPYSVYNIRVSAPGYEPVDVSGAEILSGETALQNVTLLPLDETEPDSEELFVIPPHTLYEEYPPKIPEDEVKDVTQTGEIVLSRVVIPSGVRFLTLYISCRRCPLSGIHQAAIRPVFGFSQPTLPLARSDGANLFPHPHFTFARITTGWCHSASA